MAASVKFLIPFSLLVSMGSHVEWRTATPIAQLQAASLLKIRLAQGRPDLGVVLPA
jgi:hypothetical protein